MEERALASPAESSAEEERVEFSTDRFGQVSVGASQVLDFPRGLVGIPEATRFALLHRDDSEGPFFWMQSIDDPALAFVVCEPQAFFPNYSLPLSRDDQDFLSIRTAADGLVCLILVVPGDPQLITANLRGPVVINPERRRGLQLVLQGDEYPVRALLFRPSPADGPSAAEGEPPAAAEGGGVPCSS